MAVQVNHIYNWTQSNVLSSSLSTASKAASVTWACPLPSESFSGRKNIVDKLKPLILELGHIAVLAGPGGAGKTQIALKLVKELYSRFA